MNDKGLLTRLADLEPVWSLGIFLAGLGSLGSHSQALRSAGRDGAKTVLQLPASPLCLPEGPQAAQQTQETLICMGTSQTVLRELTAQAPLVPIDPRASKSALPQAHLGDSSGKILVHAFPAPPLLICRMGTSQFFLS